MRMLDSVTQYARVRLRACECVGVSELSLCCLTGFRATLTDLRIYLPFEIVSAVLEYVVADGLRQLSATYMSITPSRMRVENFKLDVLATVTSAELFSELFSQAFQGEIDSTWALCAYPCVVVCMSVCLYAVCVRVYMYFSVCLCLFV